MTFALTIIGFFIILTTYREAKSDNSILSKESLKIFSRTIIGGYIIGALSMLTGVLFIYISYFGI